MSNENLNITDAERLAAAVATARAAHEKEPDGTQREYSTRKFLEAFENLDEDEINDFDADDVSLSVDREDPEDLLEFSFSFDTSMLVINESTSIEDVLEYVMKPRLAVELFVELVENADDDDDY